jgi:competence protein ComEC
MPSPALHPRAPLLWLLLPLMAGLIGAQRWPLPAFGPWPVVLVALAGLATAGAAAGLMRPWWWQVGIASAMAAFGFLFLHLRFPYLQEPSSLPPREVTVQLNVTQVFPSGPSSRSLSGLATIASATQDERLHGRRIYYSVIRRLGPPPLRSGTYVVQGVLEPLPADGSSFNDYLANVGVRQRLTRARVLSVVSPPGRFVRFCNAADRRLQDILGRGLENHPAPRSLYRAMLLGEKAVLSPDQENAFMRSGTFHIFSISGLHVMIVAAALQMLLGWLRVPRRAAVLISLPVLWLYVQVTGGSSPAMRAFLMTAFLLGSKVFRLPGSPLAALAASALVTLLLDPLQLFSTGFQMSYAVVTALVLMGTPLGDRWLAHWKPFALLPPSSWRLHHKKIAEYGRTTIRSFAAGWTAFLASTPAGIGFFGLFSPGSLLANLIIIPLSNLIIRAGFLSLVIGLVGLTPVSALLNRAAALVIVFTDRLLQSGVTLPGIFFNAQFRAAWLAPVSLALMTAVMLAGSAGRWSRRFGGYWLPVIVLVLLILFGVRFGER